MKLGTAWLGLSANSMLTDALFCRMHATSAHVDATLAHMDAILAHMDAMLMHKDATLADMDATLADMDATLAYIDATSADIDATSAAVCLNYVVVVQRSGSPAAGMGLREKCDLGAVFLPRASLFSAFLR